MIDKRHRKFLFWFWGVFLGLILAVFAGLLIFVNSSSIPTAEKLENIETKLATQILDENGELLCTFHVENRTNVSYDQLPKYLVQAAIATEDIRFYDHSGIDGESLFRVVVKTLLGSNASQGGGSTITQQLAKLLFPRPAHSSKLTLVSTKMKEWVTAVRLEKEYTKEEILEMYFNNIPYGSSAFGVMAAARTFFGYESPEDLKDMKLEECAVIVAMINKSSRYDPSRNYDQSINRRNLVLRRMKTAGFITEAELNEALAKPIELNNYQVKDNNAGYALHFRDMIKRYMNASEPQRKYYSSDEEYEAACNRWENDDLYGWLNKNRKANGERYNLDGDGLRIHTTINKNMQRYAEEAVEEHLRNRLQIDFNKEIKGRRTGPYAPSSDVKNQADDKKRMENSMNRARKDSDRYRRMKAANVDEKDILKTFEQPAKMKVFSWKKKGLVDTLMTPNDSIMYEKSLIKCGFVAIEPGTGRVKAYVGSPNYRYIKYDYVSQGKRQVGSTIKPFLYTLAMNGGMSPCDQVPNISQSFEDVSGTVWTPKSTDKDEYIGQIVTLKWGLAKSSNNISAFLMKQYGPEAMVSMMHQMGVSAHLDAVNALCVGAAEISPFEMVAAYNTFPSQGEYVTPIFVTSIEDAEGNVISDFSTVRRQALSARSAYLMENLMQGVVNEGTAVRLRAVYGLKGQIAGKTGTTNNNADGWFIGYTPKITAGGWVGWDDQLVHFKSLALGGGSNMALPIWGIWMKKVLADKSLGISETDIFQAPGGEMINLDCSGGDDELEEETVTLEEENYFN